MTVSINHTYSEGEPKRLAEWSETHTRGSADIMFGRVPVTDPANLPENKQTNKQQNRKTTTPCREQQQ